MCYIFLSLSCRTHTFREHCFSSATTIHAGRREAGSGQGESRGWGDARWVGRIITIRGHPAAHHNTLLFSFCHQAGPPGTRATPTGHSDTSTVTFRHPHTPRRGGQNVSRVAEVHRKMDSDGTDKIKLLRSLPLQKMIGECVFGVLLVCMSFKSIKNLTHTNTQTSTHTYT